MSDLAMDTAGVAPELTPDENAFFESGGNAALPDSGEAWADDRGEGGAESLRDDEPRLDNDRPRAEKMVSLAALHEERGRRKDLDRRNRDLETQLAEMRGRFQIIERLNAPEQEAPVTPESDIVGYARKTGENLAALQRRLDAQEMERHSEQARGQVVSAYRADAAAFEAQTPDFKAAYQHLLNSRVQELTSLGYDDPQAVHRALVSDEMSIAYSALQRGKSPAEIIYNLARQRGYAGRNGGNTAASRLDTIERGRFANKSLSHAGGSSGDVDVTADMLLRMPLEDFEAWCAKNPGRAKRIMGG